MNWGDANKHDRAMLRRFADDPTVHNSREMQAVTRLVSFGMLRIRETPVRKVELTDKAREWINALQK